MVYAQVSRANLFQLTPSRRATHSVAGGRRAGEFQLTPSRRATSDGKYLCRIGVISTHALTEGDYLSHLHYSASVPFQLTPSRRATSALFEFLLIFHFNSRPHGGRRLWPVPVDKCWPFQLTPSRRATCGSRR